MTASNREAAISKTLTYEGGYTNNPSDPGGPTNWGITIFDARKHWKPHATAADVKTMPKAVAIDIYRAKYWAVMDCDARPDGVDLVDFDLGVNSGVGRTAQFRKALDPQKLAPAAYVKAQCAMRLSFLHGLKTWGVFGKGWGKRVADVEATGVAMALRASGAPVAPALKKEAAAATKKSDAHTLAAGGSIAAPAALPDISHIDPSSKVGLVIFCAVIAGVVVYCAWNAVQNAHRSAAYTAAALKAQGT